MNHTRPSLLRFYFSLLWRHKYKCLIVSLTSCIWGISESLVPYMLKQVIDTLTFYSGNRAEIFSVLAWPLFGWIGFVSVKHVIHRFSDLISEGYIEPEVKRDIRSALFSHIVDHSYSFFQNNLSGSLADRIDEIATCFLEMYEAWEHKITPVIWAFSLSLVILYKTHVPSAIFVFVWMLSVAVLSYILSRYGRVYAQRRAQATALMMGTLVNILQNIFLVKVFAQRKHEEAFFHNIQGHEVGATLRLEWFFFTVRITLVATCVLMLSLVSFSLVSAWQASVITIGDLTLVMTTCFSMLHTIWWLSEYVAKFLKHRDTARYLYDQLLIPHLVADKPHARDLVVTEGEIVLDSVSFQYSAKTLFSDVSLRIAPGEHVGLVGFSGSGKSTFAHLILRFYDLTGGRILIDGVDIATVTQDSLRKNIAFIPQEPLLFARSLYENITYGTPNASYESVVEAAKKASIHDIIMALPHGYETVVGERALLSGGQRQRLVLARAILKNAPILILDEATSALDSITEHKIEQSLSLLMKGKTAFVIAHRLSTIQHMDRIIVFDEGALVAQGTHEELLMSNALYAQLWHTQVGTPT